MMSQIIGTKVISMQAEGVISFITGAHIDPASGKVIAFQCGFKQLLTPIDIARWFRVVYVNDHEALTTREHLLRLQSLDPIEMQILFKPVYTENGEKVGAVYDYSIDTESYKLAQLLVKKKILFFTIFETLIPESHIIEIQRDKIIVKNIRKLKKLRAVQPETV